MGRYDVDLLDGFDGRQLVYDEKKEKRYQARIWWFLFGAAVLIMLRGVTFHVHEVQMKRSYSVIEATYYEDTAQAVYREENGGYHQYDISGFSAEYEGDTIRLYYKEQIGFAEPVHDIRFWIKTYLILGSIAGFSAWRLWVIYKNRDCCTSKEEL